MSKAELSHLIIKLQEIEDPEKGRGCSIHTTGRTSDKAAAHMFIAMFEALEKQFPEAFPRAVMSFLMEDLSKEDFMKLLR